MSTFIRFKFRCIRWATVRSSWDWGRRGSPSISPPTAMPKTLTSLTRTWSTKILKVRMAGKNKLSYDKKWVKTSWTYSTDKCDKITIFFTSDLAALTERAQIFCHIWLRTQPLKFKTARLLVSWCWRFFYDPLKFFNNNYIKDILTVPWRPSRTGKLPTTSDTPVSNTRFRNYKK